MKFTSTFVSIASMLVTAGIQSVNAKSEGVAFANNDCTGTNTGTLDFGNAFCTPVNGGPWDSIQFFTDGVTQCFNVFTNSDCNSSGLIEVFIGPGCFEGIAGQIHSIQKKNC